MTEITALIPIKDIVGYYGDVRFAYKQVIHGLEQGSISTVLPDWRPIACMKQARDPNTEDMYHRFEVYKRYQESSGRTMFDDALRLRGMFLDAMVVLAIEHAVHPIEIVPILLEKATIEERYGKPVGLSTTDVAEKYVRAAGIRKITTKKGAVATGRRSLQGYDFIELGCLEARLRKQLDSVETQQHVAQRVLAAFTAHYEQAAY